MKFPPQKKPQGRTSVYVVACAGRVKIGIAMDVHARIIDLQFVCPFEVSIVATREFQTRRAAMLTERSLHAEFSGSRVHGEWFTVDPAVAAAALSRQPEQAEPVVIAGRLRSRKPGVQFGSNAPHSFA